MSIFALRERKSEKERERERERDRCCCCNSRPILSLSTFPSSFSGLSSFPLGVVLTTLKGAGCNCCWGFYCCRKRQQQQQQKENPAPSRKILPSLFSSPHYSGFFSLLLHGRRYRQIICVCSARTLLLLERPTVCMSVSQSVRGVQPSSKPNERTISSWSLENRRRCHQPQSAAAVAMS
jgi:hypothetical protein